MYFKKLVGKKVYLSPCSVDDAPKFAEWLNDLDVSANLNMYGNVVNTESEKEFLENAASSHNYAIIENENNRLIGICGLFNVDNLNQSAETGIFIGDKYYWGRGYGTEALTLLLDFGFKALNLHNVELKVYDFNGRAKRCYEKVGFKVVGRRRKALLRNLERHDIIYMDILQTDFYAHK